MNLIEEIGFIVVACIMIIFLLFRNRSAIIYKNKITEVLESKDYVLVDVIVPKRFDHGPFKLSSLRFFSLLKMLYLSFFGRLLYRKVNYKNKKGEIIESWVMIESSTLNEFVSMKWLPELQ